MKLSDLLKRKNTPGNAMPKSFIAPRSDTIQASAAPNGGEGNDLVITPQFIRATALSKS